MTQTERELGYTYLGYLDLYDKASSSARLKFNPTVKQGSRAKPAQSEWPRLSEIWGNEENTQAMVTPSTLRPWSPATPGE